MAPDPGFTVLTAFTATSTTVSIRATVTMDRCRRAERSASTTSRQMRRGMGEATQALPATMEAVNTPFPDIAAVVAMAEVAMAEDATKAQSNQAR